MTIPDEDLADFFRLIKTDNARYLAIIKPGDEDLADFFRLIKTEMREFPGRPIVAIIYQVHPSDEIRSAIDLPRLG